MLSPLVAARLRPFRLPVVLLLLLALFQAANTLLFEPTARRYERAVRRLGQAGVTGAAAGSVYLLPPRLYRLMAENARPAGEVAAMGASGGLASLLLETATPLLTESGVEVVATDPGTVTSSPRAAEVRVSLKAQASYGELVDFLDRLARSGKLIQVDRLRLLYDAPGRLDVEMTLSQHVFKIGPRQP
jgi:hypothetical protein